MTNPDDILDKILYHGPSSRTLILILAKMKEQGRLKDVVRECRRFLDLHPDDVGLRRLLAEAYEEMGFLALAQREWEQAALMIDNMTTVYWSLAQLYARQRQYAEAADMLRRYLAHHPGESDALALLREMEAAHPLEQVSSENGAPDEKAAPMHDETKEMLVDLATPTIAELYYSQGQIEAAIQTYEHVVRAHPEDTQSFRRFNQLKEMLEGTAGVDDKQPAGHKSQGEKMIAVLESWLLRIRETTYARHVPSTAVYGHRHRQRPLSGC